MTVHINNTVRLKEYYEEEKDTEDEKEDIIEEGEK